MRGLASAAERLLTTKSLCHFVNITLGLQGFCASLRLGIGSAGSRVFFSNRCVVGSFRTCLKRGPLAVAFRRKAY